ncbi:HepT-like ribonuclease domain-containing protein [Shewanella baltica]|uniref:HepT-like ribonuclease domain-containing protein n=1 Tax=Shewanella baltica TaxID=62322 RepID=UPI0039AF3498
MSCIVGLHLVVIHFSSLFAFNTAPNCLTFIKGRRLVALTVAHVSMQIVDQFGVQINTLDGFSDWRKVIGLRNALFHDYLDISPEIIRSVISQGYSDSLFVFAEQGLECLSLKSD